MSQERKRDFVEALDKYGAKDSSGVYRLKTDTSVSVVVGEVEVKNDSGNAIPVTSTPSVNTGSAVTSVNDTNVSVTLLASNSGRKGASIFNDSSAALYLKLGGAASTSSFTVKLLQDDYYEVPYNYTGTIDGIWASDASGAARITEITA